MPPAWVSCSLRASCRDQVSLACRRGRPPVGARPRRPAVRVCRRDRARVRPFRSPVWPRRRLQLGRITLGTRKRRTSRQAPSDTALAGAESCAVSEPFATPATFFAERIISAISGSAAWTSSRTSRQIACCQSGRASCKRRHAGRQRKPPSRALLLAERIMVTLRLLGAVLRVRPRCWTSRTRHHDAGHELIDYGQEKLRWLSLQAGRSSTAFGRMS